MITASLDLFTVHSTFRVILRVVLKGNAAQPTLPSQPRDNKCVDVVTAIPSEDKYIKFMPSPFIVLDASKRSPKQDIDRKYTNINLNRRDLYMLIDMLESILSDFKNIVDLFYQDMKGQIIYNEEKYKDKKYVLGLKGNTQAIFFRPGVVKAYNEKNNAAGMYEGVYVDFNQVPVSYLTIGDMQYLLTELKNLNIMQLTLNLIQASLIAAPELNQKIIGNTDYMSKPKPTESEVSEPEIYDVKIPKLPLVSEIPSI